MSTDIAATPGPDTVTSTSVPKIKIESVQLDMEGLRTRTFLVYAPAGVSPTTLMENPGMWRDVQRSNVALRVTDRLSILAADGTWLLDCFVAGADDASVSLSPGRVVKMLPRNSALFSDGIHAVFYDGQGGYGVRRLADGQVITSGLANAALAERVLLSRYPKVA